MCTCKIFAHTEWTRPIMMQTGFKLCPVLLTNGAWPLLREDSLLFGLTSSRYGQTCVWSLFSLGAVNMSVTVEGATITLSTSEPSFSHTHMHRNSKAVIPSGQSWNATYRYAMALSQETCQNKPSLTALTRHTGIKETIRDLECPTLKRAFLSYQNS